MRGSYHPLVARVLRSARPSKSGGFGLDAKTMAWARAEFLAALTGDMVPFLDLLAAWGRLRAHGIEPLVGQLQSLINLSANHLPARGLAKAVAPKTTPRHALAPQKNVGAVSLRSGRK
jgi:hypothetical protein